MDSKQIISLTAIITIIAIAVLAYAYNYNISSQTANNEYNNTASPNPAYFPQVEEPEFQPITIIDDYGYALNLTARPKRIVSLAPSNTEILFAVGAGNQVVGITNYCNYPYNFAKWVKAGNISSIGNYWNPSIEPIINLKPDLVLASGGGASDVAAEQLRYLGYNVLVLHAKDIEGVFNDILMVGNATGHPKQAEALVETLRSRLNFVVNTVKASATSKPKVYYEVWNDPLMAAGPATFINDLIVLAGGTNIFGDAATSWPIVSSDSVISKNPDIIISQSTDINTRPGWANINAVKNNRIYKVDEDIFSRPGPRLIDALEILAKIIHPELFG